VQYIASIDAGLEKPELICTIGHLSEEGFILGGADVSRWPVGLVIVKQWYGQHDE
jgi:hypothetical protein